MEFAHSEKRPDRWKKGNPDRVRPPVFDFCCRERTSEPTKLAGWPRRPASAGPLAMTQQGRSLRLEAVQGGLDRVQVTQVSELVLHVGDDCLSRR